MGVRVDLIDRDVYQINPNAIELKNEAKLGSKDEMTSKVLEDLKAKLLTGRERFLLSDKDDVPTSNPRKQSDAKE